MGSRKRLAAAKRKEDNKDVAIARLRNYPSSPRKMRLVADMIRGLDVNKAMFVLEHSAKHSSEPLQKLLKSAVANWETKNEGQDAESADLYVKTVMVDSARVLKRLRPAPQGRAHRIRKRSNHVTIIVDTKTAE